MHGLTSQFLNELLGADKLTLFRADTLQNDYHVEFVVDQFTFIAIYKDSSNQNNLAKVVQNLTASSTSILKNQVAKLVLDQNAYAVRGFINSIWEHLVSPAKPLDTPTGEKLYALILKSKGTSPIATTKAITQITGCSLQEAKECIDNLPCLILKSEPWEHVDDALKLFAACEAEAKFTEKDKVGFLKSYIKNPTYKLPSVTTGVLSTPLTPLKVPLDLKAAMIVADWKTKNPVSLVDATEIGQPVKGSGDGSRYYVIALNERVKVAARIRPADSTLSIRAEHKGATAEEKEKLASILEVKPGNYWSMHVNYATVQPERIIGAFLFGSGIDYKQQVTKASELIEEKV